jgi:prepilin-type N-terminal cleavage/methylation domain-containing protein
MEFVNNNLKIYMKKGFTIIELVVVVAIIGVLSTVILASVTQYINKSKDANVIGNLAILVSAGEVYYNGNQSRYNGFCNSSVVTNAETEIPKSSLPSCDTGICCFEDAGGDAWVACAQLFIDTDKAYCVDSRGVKKKINNADCGSGASMATIHECP